MKPYQVHLFTDENKIPEALPSEPYFVYENKRYLNFTVFDCFHMKTHECLKNAARTVIEHHGIVPVVGNYQQLYELQHTMQELKKIDSAIFCSDELSALHALFSIFGDKTTYFIDYETAPSVATALQYRNVEYYSHKDLEHLDKMMSAKSEPVLLIDGMYEWLGSVPPITEILKIAQSNECVVIANELNSFGFLGRDGRGFVDLFNCYDAINMEIGSFSRFLGGFGCYVAAKKYLTSKMKENSIEILQPLSQFMVAVNCAGLEMLKSERQNKHMYQKLWKSGRYMITRLKQLGFTTESSTPNIVVSFKNNEEAGEFVKRLFLEQVIVSQKKERLRMCLSIEHSKEDFDRCLSLFEAIGEDVGVINAEH